MEIQLLNLYSVIVSLTQKDSYSYSISLRPTKGCSAPKSRYQPSISFAYFIVCKNLLYSIFKVPPKYHDYSEYTKCHSDICWH